MKSAKILNILALLLFILGIVGLAVTFSFSKEYKIKIANLDQQNKLLIDKLTNFQNKLEDLRTSLDTFKDDNITATKDASLKISGLETAKTEIISKITMLAKDIQDLQKSYSVTISELKANIESLNSSLSANAPSSSAKVDLGQIAVEKPKQ
jgi:hypothetical protein